MNHDRTYRPVPYAPALRLRDADNSIRPHTYGVRVCSCTSIATEPCRPTACTTHATNLSSSLTDNCSLVTYHCSLSNLVSTILHSSFLILNWSHTFSAKERDLETGLSYFGARYYSSDLSIWLSVDPMSDKYPSLSPYVYCADNPVKLVDPNGEDWYIPENSTTPIWDKDVTRKNCPQNATYLGVEGCTYDGKIITHYQKDGEIKQYSASNSIRKGGFTFPVGTMTDSYKSGYAQFGTNRSNGTRKHAGCDLYAAVGTPVFAVSQGTVFEKAHFYKGTYSIAINHGSFSARYCELIPSFNVQVGMQVAEGDFLGMIGKMEGLSQSMLHFEMYNNSESGPLTNKTNGSPYFRRGDLMNPTSFLDNIRLGDYEKVPKCIYR